MDFATNQSLFDLNGTWIQQVVANIRNLVFPQRAFIRNRFNSAQIQINFSTFGNDPDIFVCRSVRYFSGI